MSIIVSIESRFAVESSLYLIPFSFAVSLSASRSLGLSGCRARNPPEGLAEEGASSVEMSGFGGEDLGFVRMPLRPCTFPRFFGL